jgi:hypothetical protein
MRQKSLLPKQLMEKVIKDIRRAKHSVHSALATLSLGDEEPTALRAGDFWGRPVDPMIGDGAPPAELSKAFRDRITFIPIFSGAPLNRSLGLRG